MEIKDFIIKKNVEFTKNTVSIDDVKSIESELGFSFGGELIKYILKYGYLAYRYIEFYGINSVQKKESDMVKQTKYLNQYFNRTIGCVALENIGDGTYALVSPEDKVYEYSSDDNSIRDTEMKLFDYILSRFKEADAQQ
jgi:hypothetical protein